MLTPTQIIEQMLKQVAKFDAAHTPGTLDNALLRVEANSLFRVLRTIEESSGQRFIVTASGTYLDLIGQGMQRPRLTGESDEDYRARLIYNPEFWNDCTVDGIKTMIKAYYGIDMDNDEYDETRLVEPYKQAAHFFNKGKDREKAGDWEDYEGWVNPASDFGAEWMGESTEPGAFEVHLRAFQTGEEKFIKKRQIKNEIMRIRAAGIVVFLFFHITHGVDTIPPLLDAGTEMELIQQDKIEPLVAAEQYEVIITNREISKIIAQARDKLSGKLSRRIVHDRQTSRCRNSKVIQEASLITDPYEIANLEQGNTAYRPEPFIFRQSRLRNDCWRFFYGVKYEERDITIPPLISIPISALVNNQPYVVGHIRAKNVNVPYIVIEITGNKGNRTVYLNTNTTQEVYTKINSIVDLQQAMGESAIGDIVLQGNVGAAINQAFRRQYKRAPIIHTYYTRPNPMLDEHHHYRCEDVHGLDFYHIIEYVDFWWRVSSVEDGVISTPSIPYKLTIAKTNNGISDFWWRVSNLNGETIGEPSKGQNFKVPGTSQLRITQPKLVDIERWDMQLGNVDLMAVCESDKQLFIVEGYNPKKSFAWQKTDIVSIKVSQPLDRFVLARLNIGYMPLNNPYLPWVPSLVQGGIFGDKLAIRFWESEWQKFIEWRIKSLLSQGFNGILLDGLDAWEMWQTGIQMIEPRMRTLVNNLRSYINKQLAQTGFVLLANGQQQWHYDASYMKSIDGIIGTNIFYKEQIANEPLVLQTNINNLNAFLVQNKAVFVTEHLSDLSLIATFQQQARQLNFKSRVA